MKRKGFVLIVVLSFILVLAISGAGIFFLTNSETIQARRQISMTRAFYAADAGAERMYRFVKDHENDPQSVVNQQIVDEMLVIDEVVVSTYDVSTSGISALTAQQIAELVPPGGDALEWGTITITSTGSSGGVSRNVIVEYVLQDIDFKNPALMSLSDLLSLQGHKEIWWFWWIEAGVYIEELMACNGVINKEDPTDTIHGPGAANELENLSQPSPVFMSGNDANRDGDQITDTNGDSAITVDDIPIDPETGEPEAEQLAIFSADDVNSDGAVTEQDGFTHYYTDAYNYSDVNGNGEPDDDLGMDPDNPSHPYYYSGDTTFGPESGAPYLWDTVPDDTNIVFVDGDVDIYFNPDAWDGERDITIVSTGDVTIVEPCNGDNDRLTLVSYGDISTGGINIQFIDFIDSNMNAYSHGDFYAYYGGDTEGTIISNGIGDIDTMEASLLYTREIEWNDNIVSNPPLGLPPMSLTDFGSAFVQNTCKIPRNYTVGNNNRPYSWNVGISGN